MHAPARDQLHQLVRQVPSRLFFYYQYHQYSFDIILHTLELCKIKKYVENDVFRQISNNNLDSWRLCEASKCT